MGVCKPGVSVFGLGLGFRVTWVRRHSFNYRVLVQVVNNHEAFLKLSYVLQDMSSYVKKVHFKLHESYANPLRGKRCEDL